MLKRMLIMVFALLLLFGGIFGWKYYADRQMQRQAGSKGAPTATVTATTASNKVWHPALHAVATLRAVQGTDVSPQLDGMVREIHFKSGQQVNQGDLLVQLDVTVEQAELKGLEAEQDLAQTHLKRIRDLSKTQVVAESDLDQAEAGFRKAQAAVKTQKELIERKTIRAPFTGVAGIRQVNLGDYLAAGTKIVTLQSLNPIHADFSLPQQDFSQVKVGQEVRLRVDAYPEREFKGLVTSINPKVTETTRNFMVRATLTNTDLTLRPGMFAEVAVQLPEQRNVVTVPRTAITYNPYGDSVFIVQKGTNGQGKAELKVRRTFVQTGDERGTQVAILKGVRAGQQVVTAGQMKLREGSSVVIDNTVAPINEASATPADEH